MHRSLPSRPVSCFRLHDISALNTATGNPSDSGTHYLQHLPVTEREVPKEFKKYLYVYSKP